ncbi:hypothetical protein C5167_010524 [Papaver somniferum]|uniref:Uncharacterized protein n=1 Tax=Papaver somniferum TaxID=3469 RepID=A0A4Y7K0G8_PAPSO|nr:hypothetical protein C5167_010524 [Papaver somniferum]
MPPGSETMWTLRKVNGDYVSRRPEGNFLITFSWDYQICFWEIKKPEISTGNVPEEATICCQPVTMLQHFTSDSACTIDATTIFSGGKVMLWAASGGPFATAPKWTLLTMRQISMDGCWDHTTSSDGLDGAFRLSDKDSKQSLKAMPAFSTHPIEVWAVRVLHVNPAVIPLENPFWRCRGCHRVVVPKKRAFLNVSTVKYGVNEHGPGSLLIVLDMAVINSNVTSRGGAGASPVGSFSRDCVRV